MQRRGLLFIGMARAVSAILGFVAVPIYTSFLSPEVYGTYALVLAWVALAKAAMFHWSASAAARLYPQHLAAPEVLVGGALRLWVLGAALATGGCLLSLPLVSPETWRLVATGTALLLALSAYELALEFVRSALRPGLYAAAVVMSSIVSLLVGVAAAAHGFGVRAPLLGAIVGYTMGLVVMIWQGRLKAQWPRNPASRNALDAAMFAYGFPLAGGLVLAMAIPAVERHLVAAELGMRDLGIYAAAYGLVFPAVTVLASVVNISGYPLIVRAHEAVDLAARTLRLGHQVSTLAALLAPALFGVWLLADDLAQALPREEYASVSTLLPWIAAAAVMNALRGAYTDLAFHLKRTTGWIAVSLGTALLIDAASNRALLSRIGILGAAIALCASYAAALLLSIVVGARHVRLPPPSRRCLLPITAGLLLMWLTLSRLTVAHSVGGLVLSAVAGALAYGMGYWACSLCGRARTPAATKGTP